MKDLDVCPAAPANWPGFPALPAVGQRVISYGGTSTYGKACVVKQVLDSGRFVIESQDGTRVISHLADLDSILPEAAK